MWPFKSQLWSKDDYFLLFCFSLPSPPSSALLPTSLESSDSSHTNICATLSVPWGLVMACHLLAEINFSFRCWSFSFLFAKKPQDVVVCYPWKWYSPETCCHLLPFPSTLVLPGDGFFFAYGSCWHLTFPSKNNVNDTRIWVTETSLLVADNPHCLRQCPSCHSDRKWK